jgi:hypothetical protein
MRPRIRKALLKHPLEDNYSNQQQENPRVLRPRIQKATLSRPSEAQHQQEENRVSMLVLRENTSELNTAKVVRFFNPTEEKVNSATIGHVPVNTQKSCEQWMRVLRDFCNATGQVFPQEGEYNKFTLGSIIDTFVKFILGARQKNGQEYSASTLKTGINSLVRELRNHYPGLTLYPKVQDDNMKLKNALDNEMRRLQGKGSIYLNNCEIKSSGNKHVIPLYLREIP